MKVTSLRFLAGTGGVLVVAGAAPGAFSGITVANVPNQFGLITCRVFAQFSDPDDRLVAVGGTPDAPLEISVTGGTFYQHPFGTDLPGCCLLAAFPSLRYDTFVDIGKLSSDFPFNDDTLLFPGWPGFGPSTLSATSSGWFVTPDSVQAAPDAQERVLLGQFSTADGAGFTGQVLLQVISNGQPVQAHVRFCHPSDNAFCHDGDLDGNSVIDIRDFLLLLLGWGPCKGCPGDINGDGAVGVEDMQTLLANWTIVNQVPAVSGDLNGDGVVNIVDLLMLLFCAQPPPGGCTGRDLDGDGVVGFTDLLLLLGNWG